MFLAGLDATLCWYRWTNKASLCNKNSHPSIPSLTRTKRHSGLREVSTLSPSWTKMKVKSLRLIFPRLTSMIISTRRDPATGLVSIHDQASLDSVTWMPCKWTRNWLRCSMKSLNAAAMITRCSKFSTKEQWRINSRLCKRRKMWSRSWKRTPSITLT